MFSSWGLETIDAVNKDQLTAILEELAYGNEYGDILRAKGMLPGEKEGEWYYFGENGKMIEGWLESKGAYYYLNNGKMIAGKTVTIGGTDYSFDANGACTSAIGGVSVTHAGGSTSSTGSTTTSTSGSNAVTAATPGGSSSTVTTPGSTGSSNITTSEPGTSTTAGPGGVSQYETTQAAGPGSVSGSSNVTTSSPVSTTTSSSGAIEELKVGSLTGPM